MTTTRQNRQVAPYPEDLDQIVRGLVYMPGWTVLLRDVKDRDKDADGKGIGGGLTMLVRVDGPNSYRHDEQVSVVHYFPVPAATYNYESWRRWVLDRLLQVHVHEACEFFTVDGEKPYAPNHGPGHDPWTIRELSTDQDRRTSFKGVVKPKQP